MHLSLIHLSNFPPARGHMMWENSFLGLLQYLNLNPIIYEYICKMHVGVAKEKLIVN